MAAGKSTSQAPMLPALGFTAVAANSKWTSAVLMRTGTTAGGAADGQAHPLCAGVWRQELPAYSRVHARGTGRGPRRRRRRLLRGCAQLSRSCFPLRNFFSSCAIDELSIDT